MRVWCGGLVLVAVSLGILAGGCDRQKNAGKSPTTRAPSRFDVDAKAPVEPDPAKRLFRALVHRDQNAVSKVLADHPELVNRKLNKSYPLSLACASRSLPLVQAMVERGADPKLRNDDGTSTLAAAVESDSLPIVRYLVAKGADPKALEVDGETLLWHAQSVEVARFLVEAGVDPKRRDNVGDMAIHHACRKSRKEVVEFLLDSGVGIEEKGHWDMPPLHFAVSTVTGDPLPVVRMLLARGANIRSRGYLQNTVIHECAFYNRLEMAELLLSRGAESDVKNAEGRTPKELAELAGKNDRIRVINLLIKHGAPGQLLTPPK
jgi:ankyrin repeat protein